MFKAFIDESGNDAREPVIIAGAWVGAVNDWENFSDPWADALVANNPKPLVAFGGEVYFKHSEARSCRKCFAGFDDKEAELKTVGMAKVISQHNVGAIATVLERKQYFEIVDEMVVQKSGRLYREYIKDPLFIALHHLVGLVLGTQYVNNPGDKVDFIFDEGSMTDRVISMYKFIREHAPDVLRPLYGEAIPMNDKQVMPLQAADLLAGQIRMATQYGGQPAPLFLLRQTNRNWIYPINERDIRTFLSQFNVVVSTRRLELISAERVGIPSARQQSKKRGKK